MLELVLSWRFVTDLLASTVRMTTPVGFAALGGVFSDRGGVVNIALEGMMLMGAFFGFLGAYLTGNIWLGLLLAMAAGGAVGLLYAFLSITLRASQLISAIGINILCLGITSSLNRVVFGLVPLKGVRLAFQPLRIPLLGDIPFLGPILFQHVPLVYMFLLLAPVVAFIVFRTNWGLALRAVGEHPKAVDTAGINVHLVRYIGVIVSALLAGTGGAFLTLGQGIIFVENLTAGRGFIAYAALAFGKWHPIGAFGAAFLFGAVDSLQLRLQGLGLGVPPQLMLALPYLVTLLALAGFVGRVVPPAAYGQPYTRGKE